MRTLLLLSVVALPFAPALAAPNPAEERAIFTSAGFIRTGGQWRTPDCIGLEGASYTPGVIETYRDLNGDGRPEAVISEGSAICYGNTGTHFWLLSKQSNGSWKHIIDETAIPGFLASKGADGWPDISMGGPGFCFPVWRWNGNEYDFHRLEYEGRPCRR